LAESEGAGSNRTAKASLLCAFGRRQVDAALNGGKETRDEAMHSWSGMKECLFSGLPDRMNQWHRREPAPRCVRRFVKTKQQRSEGPTVMVRRVAAREPAGPASLQAVVAPPERARGPSPTLSGRTRGNLSSWLPIALLAVFLQFGPSGTAMATPGDILLVDAETATLRRAPSPASPIRKRLNAGQKLMEFERRAGWVRVVVFATIGEEGWVAETSVVREPRPPVSAPHDLQPEPATTPGHSRFTLHVAGSPALAYRLDCRLVKDGRNLERWVHRGWVPEQIELDASAVSCTVQKLDARGRLRVRLVRSDETVAFAETAAAFNWVRVRSTGPWGKARGLRGDLAVASTVAVERPRSGGPKAFPRIVPPLRAGLIPELRPASPGERTSSRPRSNTGTGRLCAACAPGLGTGH
jgi:hypothetical protein